jgi:hypothetical protein
MRFALMAVAAISLMSCASAGPSHAPVFGFVWLVSHDDVCAAIAAVQAAPKDKRNMRVDHVEVIGHNTIYVYHSLTEWRIARRVASKWQYSGSWFEIE